MSEEVFYTGRVRKISDNVEDFCKQKCLEKNIPLTMETWRQQFYLTDDSSEYLFVNDKVYHIFEQTRYEDDYFIRTTTNEDGSFSFSTKFYNGGTCLQEVLEEEIINKNL